MTHVANRHVESSSSRLSAPRPPPAPPAQAQVPSEEGEANCVKESSQQRPRLYNTEWSSFPGLKEGQWDRINVATAVMCSLAGRQNEPPHPTATEVSCKLTLCSLWMLPSTSLPRTTFPQHGSQELDNDPCCLPEPEERYTGFILKAHLMRAEEKQ
ncbi:hypothetical protein AMECASPLE_019786, partial [Ameca splendens]